ncbi:DNRLRE domain-containing protein [Priestia megaterium]|uniref:DNRLRE domain-containing protein n=1 Tax=Priestia megaterium TaxID=1404 RepID=UPI003D06EA7B
MSSASRSIYRYVVMIISLCLIISFVGPNFVKAAPGEAKRTPKKETLSADMGELPSKLPKQKLELTSKRTKYSTRYLNPDGTFTEQIFLDPQFYQDPSDKKWKKIDNTLKVSTKKAGKLENTANDVKTWLSNQAGTSDLASVEKDGKSVSLVPLQAKNVKGISKGNEITYPGIFLDTDARYSINGDTLKEDLILQQYHTNTFTFELKLKGVKPVVGKDGSISFTDSKNNKVWYFKNLFMTDASGKYSDKVSLKLREENEKTYVDVIADQAFLQDKDTKYPVTIDPSIDTWDVQRDNFVASSFPSSIYSSNTYMDTGYNSYFGSTRDLVQFYLPSLPSDSKISSATFKAYQTQVDATNVSVDLNRITSNWTNSVTWNTQPTIQSTPESTVTSNASNAYWQWTVTQLIKDWYNGVTPNYGFMLKQQNETTSPYRTFNTVNNGNNTPQLTVNYTVDPIGMENYWGLTKDGVNPANGNFVFQKNDLSIPGRGVPVNVTRTYNSRKSDVAGIFGYGWTSTIEKRLVDSGNGPITLIDEDNTRHIFGQKIGGGYVAAGGDYLTLVKNGDGTYTITQKDGTKENYNTSGKLSSIVDTNGNKTVFTYNENGKIASVKDASGRSTSLTYGTNGYVSSMTDPANRTINYGYDGSGNLVNVTDAAGKITTLSYDSSHTMTGIIDSRNITTTISYDASNRIKNISRPITINGTLQTSTTTYSYDTTNLVTSMTDGEGKRIDYTYTANGNVIQVTENPLDSANKSITTYTYDNNNNLTQIQDPNTNKAGGTSKYVYTYDGNGNITAVQLPGGQTSYNTFDSQNNLTQEQDFNSNITSSDYDSNNNLMESTDANTQTSASRYDANGNIEYDTKPISVADNKLANSSFELDSNTDNWPDNWTKATEAGKTASFAWSTTSKFGAKSISISNPTGWALAQSDKVPYVTGDKYIVSGYVKTSGTIGTSVVKIEFLDSAGAWISEKPAYQLKGTQDWTRIQAVIDSVPANTAYIRVSVGLNTGSGTAYFDGVQLEKGNTLSSYNLIDNSSFERNLGINSIPNNWTTSGNLSSINDGIDKNVNIDDDNVYAGAYAFKMTGEKGKNKYIKQHITFSGDSSTPLTLSGWSKQAGADANGGSYTLQVAINNADGTVDWTNANDFSKTNNEWQHVAAQVKPTKSFNSIDVYYYYYDQLGTAWFDSMRLELGNSITNYTYDALGNYNTEVDNPVGNNITNTYDNVGNQTSTTDGKGQKTSFAYDVLNRLTKVTDANQGITSYGYDSVGNQTSITDANNHVTNFGYNEWNLVSSITNPLNQVMQYGYDKNGNRTKVTLPKGDSISYTYNGLNRMDSISYNGSKKWNLAYDANGNLTSAIDLDGKSTTYTYDKNNRVTQMAEGTLNKIDYVNDNNGNPTSLTVTAGTTTISTGYKFDQQDQVTELSRNGVNQVKFVYDEQGNVISVNRSNGTYTSYEYDDANRLKSLKNYNNSGSLLDSYKYTYDANGNQTSIVTNTGTISYQYDALDQLTQETLIDGTTIAYKYDSVGNRIKKTVTQGSITTTNYTYDAANELTDVNGQAYSYDSNGNLTGNGSKTFIYDVENHLIQVKKSDGTSLATFTYDYEGKRTSMTNSTGTIYFHYDGDKVVYETDINNNIVADYTWDDQGNPETMTKSGTTYYYHLNGHGDVTALTDASGNTVAQYQYDAWGNIISQTGTMATANPYRFAGYRYDEATGLYYLISRYYDSNVGRFITSDTFQGYVDNPLSLNQYIYTENNPVMLIDPDGHTAVGTIKTISTKVSASTLKRKMGVQKITSKLVNGPINATLGGAMGTAAKTKLQGGLIGLSTYALVTVIGLGSKIQVEETKKYLSKIKAGHAKGIVLKQKYRYTYMNGAGTGWYPYGKASVDLYY